MFKQIKPIVIRIVWSLLVMTVETFADETPMLINFGSGGGWYEPATSGQGFSFDVVPESNQLVAYWFTYPEEGDSREWYIAQGDINGDSASLVIYQTTNGAFDQPSDVELMAVGTAFLEYESCQSAYFEYFIDSTGVGGEIELQRLGTARFCEQFLTGANLEAVSAGNSWVNLGGEWLFEGCVQLGHSASHGNEWLEFTETTMVLEIANYDSPDCTGVATLQTIEMDIQRVDKASALLDGEAVIANRYVLSDPVSGAEVRQLWYVDDSGEFPVVTHGVLDSTVDEDGFPTELHGLFFTPVPSGH
jgi:hypothetical protein